ncbi:furin-like protease kpc-1 isoform 2-T3 [Spheniscus humboldti]
MESTSITLEQLMPFQHKATQDYSYRLLRDPLWGAQETVQNVFFSRQMNLGTDERGRKGYCGGGNIFIWASGNGGLASDCSGADGYMNSI